MSDARVCPTMMLLLKGFTRNKTKPGLALLTQMCWRSLLFTGYKTQLVPTSFTAHHMSMSVTTPDWLSWEKKITSHPLFHNDLEYSHSTACGRKSVQSYGLTQTHPTLITF